MKAYIEFISEIDSTQIKSRFNAMSEDKKEAVLRIKNEKKKIQRIIADGLLRKKIASFCSVNADEIIFDKNKFGKPHAINADVKFSVSHSGDAVVCVLSENEIGVDIERIREVNLRSAKRFATDKELDFIGDNSENFFKIWTLKEAYFKCVGTGLGSDIKSVSFNINGDKIECSEKGCKFSFLKVYEGYCCSVCEKIKRL